MPFPTSIERQSKIKRLDPIDSQKKEILRRIHSYLEGLGFDYVAERADTVFFRSGGLGLSAKQKDIVNNGSVQVVDEPHFYKIKIRSQTALVFLVSIILGILPVVIGGPTRLMIAMGVLVFLVINIVNYSVRLSAITQLKKELEGLLTDIR